MKHLEVNGKSETKNRSLTAYDFMALHIQAGPDPKRPFSPCEGAVLVMRRQSAPQASLSLMSRRLWFWAFRSIAGRSHRIIPSSAVCYRFELLQLTPLRRSERVSPQLRNVPWHGDGIKDGDRPSTCCTQTTREARISVIWTKTPM